jgi:uncharacterized integral membrane protein
MGLLFLLLLAAVLFAFSNQDIITLKLWPTPYQVNSPLSLVVLGGMIIAYFAGVLSRWWPLVSLRRRLKRAEGDLLAAQNQLRLANQQLAVLQSAPVAVPPPPAYPSSPYPSAPYPPQV